MGGGGWERRRKSSVEIHSGRKQTRNRLSRGERGRTGFLKTPVELSHTRPRPDALFKCVQLENALVLWRIRLPVGLEGDFTAFAGLGYSHSFCLFSPLPRAISSARFAVAASRGRETSFFFRGTPHDAHGLIALHGVTRSYFLPFYAVSRREMFVSSVGRRQPRATSYRWFGVSSRALSFSPKASRYSFQVARAACRKSLKAVSTLPPWVTKRGLQTLGLEGEKSFLDNVIAIAVCSGKIWLIDQFVDLLYVI